MRNSARRPRAPQRKESLIGTAAVALGSAVARNPMIVGSATGFLVTLFYVSANALWYQPHRHAGAFLQTRVVVEREEAWPTPEPAPQPEAHAPDGVSQEAVASVPKSPSRHDADVETVQRALSELDLYAGAIDGISGPQTRKAIADYQQSAGLPVTGRVSDELIGLLAEKRAEEAGGTDIPVPSRNPAANPANASSPETQARLPDRMIMKVQAGLRAFGHDGVDVDGIVGERTVLAIREFQKLFGLPVSGKIDPVLITKMNEIGLIEG